MFTVKKPKRQKFVLDSEKITAMECDEDFCFISGNFSYEIKKFDQGINSNLSCTESEIAITRLMVSEHEMKPLIKYLCKFEPKFKSLKDELENQTFKRKGPYELMKEARERAWELEMFGPRPTGLAQRSPNFYQDYPSSFPTFHRGHFERIPMKTFIDAKNNYFKKNYQEALKCINDFISEHLESNPYPLSHEKGSPPRLYHDAYHLKGLCLIGLEMWDDALTTIRCARDAADLIYPKDSVKQKEIQSLLNTCLNNLEMHEHKKTPRK